MNLTVAFNVKYVVSEPSLIVKWAQTTPLFEMFSRKPRGFGADAQKTCLWWQTNHTELLIIISVNLLQWGSRAESDQKVLERPIGMDVALAI